MNRFPRRCLPLLIAVIGLVSFQFVGTGFTQNQGSGEPVKLTGGGGEITLNENSVEPGPEGESLEPGDTLRTEDGASATLRIRGDVLIELDENSDFTVETVDRTTEERGLIWTEEVEVTTAEFNLEEGRVLNTIESDLEGREYDFRIRTPTAVAGIRGTVYEVSVQQDGVTRAGVLEGELSLSPLETPGEGITLGRNQRSRLTAPDADPAAPQPLTEAQQQRLDIHRRRAERKLSPSPEVQSFRVEGEVFSDGRRIRQVRPGEISLSGRVSFPGGTEPGGLVLRLNDQRINLGETGEWSYVWDRDPPAVGDTTAVTVGLIATNSLGKSVGDTRTLRIVNPRPEGDLPWGYEQGELDYEVTSVADRPLDGMEFPYHLFKNDLTGGRLDVSLTAPDGIVGLAYSTRPYQEWTVLEPGTVSQFRISSDLFRSDRRLWIRGWTADGVLGYPRLVGTFQYHDKNLTEVARRLVRSKWELFERENYSRIVNLLHPNLQAEFNPGNRSLNQEQYKDDFLRASFREWMNLRAITEIQGNRVLDNEGEVNLLLEVKGEFGRGLPFLWRSSIDHEVKRLPNGKLSLRGTDVSGGITYNALESVTIDHLKGFSYGRIDNPLPNRDCSEPGRYDLCVDLVSTGTSGSIDNNDGIAADPNTVGSSSSHTVKFKVDDDESDIHSDSLNGIKIIYGAGSNPADVSGITSSGDITTLTLGGSDVTGDISGVTPEDGGTTLSISLGGSNTITDGDVIKVETASDVINPDAAGNYDVQVSINDTVENLYQLDIIEEDKLKLIPSTERGTRLKELSVSSITDVERLPDESLFTGGSRVLQQGDIYAVRTTVGRQEKTGLVEFESITTGENGSASLRIIRGQTLLEERGVEEYPGFDIFRELSNRR